MIVWSNEKTKIVIDDSKIKIHFSQKWCDPDEKCWCFSQLEYFGLLGAGTEPAFRENQILDG